MILKRSKRIKKNIDLDIIEYEAKRKYSKDEIEIKINKKTKNKIVIEICYPKHMRELNLIIYISLSKDFFYFKTGINPVIEKIFFFLLILSVVLIVIEIIFNISFIEKYFFFIIIWLFLASLFYIKMYLKSLFFLKEILKMLDIPHSHTKNNN